MHVASSGRLPLDINLSSGLTSSSTDNYFLTADFIVGNTSDLLETYRKNKSEPNASTPAKAKRPRDMRVATILSFSF